MAPDRSTEIISMIEWIRTNRLPIKNSLSLIPSRCSEVRHREANAPLATLLATPMPSNRLLQGTGYVRENEDWAEVSNFTSSDVIARLPRKVDIRLPGKGNSNSHGARPVHQKHRWIRTSRLSIKNSFSHDSPTLPLDPEWRVDQGTGYEAFVSSSSRLQRFAFLVWAQGFGSMVYVLVLRFSQYFKKVA